MNPRPAAPRLRCTVAAGLALLASAAVPVRTAGAQPARTVQGVVRDATGLPVEGAQLSIAGTALRAESGMDGRFTITSVPASVPHLQVRRLGFRADSLALGEATGNLAGLTVVLERVAAVLHPMMVTARRVVDGPMAGFHRRKETGSGRFFTAAEIERRRPNRLSDLLRTVPSIRMSPTATRQSTMRVRGARCAPSFWLDGTPLSGIVEFDIDALDPRTFEGIEVYSGPASVPVEFQRDRFASSSCGTILLWSKRGGRQQESAPRASQGSPTARIATLVEEQKVFTDRDVDTPARIDSIVIVRAGYPDSLYTAGIRGRVLVEFVVSAEGEVQIGTFNVVTATHRAFIEPVREALREQKYIPAQRRGVAVAQVVLQPFEFAPETTARRR